MPLYGTVPTVRVLRFALIIEVMGEKGITNNIQVWRLILDTLRTENQFSSAFSVHSTYPPCGLYLCYKTRQETKPTQLRSP